jgi:hypothetical protein
MGAIRNVVIDNVISHARGTSTITGHPERRIENVTISNLQMFMQEEDYVDKRATDAIRAQGVDGLKLRNVSVKWAEDKTEPKWASAASFRDASGLELDNFASRQGLRNSPHPTLVFDNVNGAIVRHSRADDGCGVFLALRGARTRDIKMRDNDLDAARKSVEFETPALKKVLVVDK